MDNKFITFIKPYLSFIDRGEIYRKPFHWLYAIFGILNLLFPLLILYTAIDGNLFDAKAKIVIVFILLWLVIAFVSWLSFQLWWNRRNKLSEASKEGDDFVATPVFSHFIQTTGEWLGTWIGIVGFLGAIIVTLFLGNEASFLTRRAGIPYIEAGIIPIVSSPIIGFLIIIISRFAAEQFRALAAIANNTRKN